MESCTTCAHKNKLIVTTIIVLTIYLVVILFFAYLAYRYSGVTRFVCIFVVILLVVYTPGVWDACTKVTI